MERVRSYLRANPPPRSGALTFQGLLRATVRLGLPRARVVGALVVVVEELRLELARRGLETDDRAALVLGALRQGDQEALPEALQACREPTGTWRPDDYDAAGPDRGAQRKVVECTMYLASFAGWTPGVVRAGYQLILDDLQLAYRSMSDEDGRLLLDLEERSGVGDFWSQRLSGEPARPRDWAPFLALMRGVAPEAFPWQEPPMVGEDTVPLQRLLLHVVGCWVRPFGESNGAAERRVLETFASALGLR